MPWAIREDWEAQDCPDIYFTRAYTGLYARGEARALLFEFAEGEAYFRLPFLESPVPAAVAGPTGNWRDMESAYGYGGPWTNAEDPGFLRRAEGALAECCRERRILAGFLRFHPMLENHRWDAGFEVIPDRLTVCVDLKDADLWMGQISQKNRNMIRKAERDGVTFELDPGFTGLGDFVDLYRQTMARLGARAAYAFDDGYFAAMPAALGGRSFLAHARYGGERVASAAFMAWGKWGHYHLSGSRKDSQRLAPNNLLIYGSMLSMRERGCERFHMGGGLGADPEDPLFKFKKSFSPRTCGFHIGKRVFFPEAYAGLREGWTRANPERAAAAGTRLLFYRD